MPIDTTAETPLAAQLARLISEKGTTARKVAAAAGLSTDAVRNLLKGRATSPRATTLQALADALGVPGAALMSGFATAEAVPAPAERPAGWVDVPQITPFEVDVATLLDVPAEGFWRLPEALLAARGVSAAEAVVVRFKEDESAVHRAGDYVLVDTRPSLGPPRRGGWVVLRDQGFGYALAEYRREGDGLERRHTLHEVDGKEIDRATARVAGRIVARMLG